MPEKLQKVMLFEVWFVGFKKLEMDLIMVIVIIILLSILLVYSTSHYNYDTAAITPSPTLRSTGTTANSTPTALEPVRKDPEILTKLMSSLYIYTYFYPNLTDDVFEVESLREESPQYQLINSIFCQTTNFYKFNINLNDFQLESLREESLEYQIINRRFLQSTRNRSFFKLHSIEKVHNPYLLLQYGLKKNEYDRRGIVYEETLLFHGTKKDNIDDICRNNFNWRLTGTAFGSRVGQGVNFASEAYFSTHYCDDGYNKVMIIANVLIGNSCRGNSDMAIPLINCDTSTNDNQNVFVKYDDNTFYPSFIIHFGGIDYKNKNRTSVTTRSF